MRRQDRAITDRRAIDAILDAATVCHLGLWDGQEPYVVPLSFGYDGQAIYLHAASEGRKLEIIAQQPQVCFEMETEVRVVPAERGCAWSAHYRSVIGWGRASLVEDEQAKSAALNLILAHHGGAPEQSYAPEMLKRTAVIRIAIQRLTAKQND